MEDASCFLSVFESGDAKLVRITFLRMFSDCVLIMLGLLLLNPKFWFAKLSGTTQVTDFFYVFAPVVIL